MSNQPKSTIGAEERAELFYDKFDFSLDASVTLASIVRHLGDYLSLIVGRDVADAAMANVIASLAGNQTGKTDWRAELEENESSCFSAWPLGALLHDLAAYARFGIVLSEYGSAPEPRNWLEASIRGVVEFRDRSPLSQWLGQERAPQLEELIMLAEARWALDNNKPVEPAALAIFGDVSDGRMRNLMSGASRLFTPDSNKNVPAHEALAWLEGRDSFWPSIWRQQPLPRYALLQSQPIDDPVFLPVARDGSVFHPGVRRRSGTYTIGEKSDEQHISAFDDALAELQRMPVARWRRPNEAGNWGIVSGVRWARFDTSELDAIAATPGYRLPLD